MSGLFISNEMYEARNDVGRNRTQEECIQDSNQLYEILKVDIQKAKNTKGRDYITYSLDRKIGKTYNLAKLAIEYDYMLIVNDSTYAMMIKQEAKKISNKTIRIVYINSDLSNLNGLHCETILKDEMVDIVKLRDKLVNVGLGWVNIVGIN